MQNLMDNPAVLRSIMTSNPQMRALLDANPELNHMLSDPAMLRQTMEMARNPEAMRQAVRNQDLAMSQIENVPGGFNALSRMYHDVQEPMLDAMSAAHSSAAGADTSASTSEGVSQEGPLPNPWAAAPGAGASARAGAGMSMGSSGGGGMLGGGMPDMNAMMQNSAVQSMVRQMHSGGNSPGMAFPFFAMPPPAAAANSNGEAAGVASQGLGFSGLLADMGAATASSMPMTGPFVASSPAASSSSAQVMSTPVPTSWQNAVPPPPPTTTTSTANVPSSAVPPANITTPFHAEAPLPAPASAAPTVDARYPTQLGQLVSMGFSDGAANLEALEQSGGNLNAAVERLLGGLEG